jgi:hypothetical protein
MTKGAFVTLLRWSFFATGERRIRQRASERRPAQNMDIICALRSFEVMRWRFFQANLAAFFSPLAAHKQ